MHVFSKLKTVLKKKSKKKTERKQDAVVTPEPTRSPRILGCQFANHNVSPVFERKRNTDYTSLVALASGAVAKDIEKYNIESMHDSVHSKTVMSLRAPIGRGVLADFLSYMLYRGATPVEINTLLGIQWDTVHADSDVHLSELPFVEGEGDIVAAPANQPLWSWNTTSDMGFLEPTPTEMLITVHRPDSHSDTPVVSDNLGSSISSALIATRHETSVTALAPKLSDFDLLKQLGQGAFGTVVLALHRASGAQLALKAIQKPPPYGGDANDEDIAYVLNSVMYEFFSHLRAQGEQTILEIHAAFESPNYFFMATTFHPHGDLADALETMSNLPYDVALFWIADLILALEAFRKHGIVHRDLKPENILIDVDGHLVVADLGLSRCSFKSDMLSELERDTLPADMRCDATEQTQMFCGTPSYLAPEVILEKEYSYPVDVWSFGVIVFQMFFGRLPFNPPPRAGTEALFDAIVRGRPGITNSERRILPRFVEDFIASALDTNPDTRYTPEQLRAHGLFKDFDWDLHASSSVPNWPDPDPECTSSLKEVTGPLLNEMRISGLSDVLTGNHFSFLSAALQDLSSTPSLELSAGEASPSPSPSPELGSPVDTSPSTTFVADTPDLSANSGSSAVFTPSPTPSPLHCCVPPDIKARSF